MCVCGGDPMWTDRDVPPGQGGGGFVGKKFSKNESFGFDPGNGISSQRQE